MKRILLTVSYDGSAYHGFQVQDNADTIAGRLTEALFSLTGEKTELIGGSRTDAGVHALCNKTAFDTSSKIEAGKFARALNAYLPEDIRVLSSKEVSPSFHPLAEPSRKTYEYRILNRDMQDPLRRLYTDHVRYALDPDRMAEGAAFLEGEHDFASFCSAGAQVSSTVRTVYECSVQKENDEIVIRVSGNGFLYNMVRIIAGTLIEVGRGALSPDKIPVILENKDRSGAGPTAPPQGLTLVSYSFLSES